MIVAVVLTYAPAPGMLEECLEALRGGHAGDPSGDTVQVVLVDNGGPTGAASRLPAHLAAGVDVVVQPTNTGYAGGMNAGIHRALSLGASAVFVLNDDVVVEPGWLQPLLDELADPAVGAVQPALLFAGEPPTINSLGVAIGADGAGTDIGMHDPADLADARLTTPVDLEAFTGGAVLVRDEFVRATGGFDDRYFLYYEDVDLSLRGRELGWRIRLAPTSRVRHRGSATVAAVARPDRTGDRARDRAGDRIVHLRERNRIWVLLRHRSASEVRTGLWLSVRRLRRPPRRTHAAALAAGLAAAPRLLLARRSARRSRPGSIRP